VFDGAAGFDDEPQAAANTSASARQVGFIGREASASAAGRGAR
jgi:hypothetical protein